ncbi:MAG: hypothetical protein ACJ79S_06470, partial [Gemmatimonadaceae bacterium]
MSRRNTLLASLVLATAATAAGLGARDVALPPVGASVAGATPRHAAGASRGALAPADDDAGAA